MSFNDDVFVGDLTLRDHISFWADHGETLTGMVTGLAMIGEDPDVVRVTLQLEPSGSIAEFDWAWGRSVSLEW